MYVPFLLELLRLPFLHVLLVPSFMNRSKSFQQSQAGHHWPTEAATAKQMTAKKYKVVEYLALTRERERNIMKR
jgi:hypothetical protein